MIIDLTIHDKNMQNLPTYPERYRRIQAAEVVNVPVGKLPMPFVNLILEDGYGVDNYNLAFGASIIFEGHDEQYTNILDTLSDWSFEDRQKAPEDLISYCKAWWERLPDTQFRMDFYLPLR